MLQHVYERAIGARRLEQVWIATDDRRIADAAARFGAPVVMTRADHPSGSDRVAEAASAAGAAFASVVVNIQGDQPLLDPAALDALVDAFDAEPAPDMATLFEPLRSAEDLMSPHVAKVVADARGHALYFSRSPIPYVREEGAAMEPMDAGRASRSARLGGAADSGWLKHVGVYAFSRAFLFEFTALPPGRLERLEGLEQLRALEAGRRVRLVPSSGLSVSVETPDDLARVEQLLVSKATT